MLEFIGAVIFDVIAVKIINVLMEIMKALRVDSSPAYFKKGIVGIFLIMFCTGCHDSSLVGEWAPKCSKIWNEGVDCKGFWEGIKLGPSGDFESTFTSPPSGGYIMQTQYRGTWSTSLFGKTLVLNTTERAFASSGYKREPYSKKSELFYDTWAVNYNVKNDGGKVDKISTRELALVTLEDTEVDNIKIETVVKYGDKDEASKYCAEMRRNSNRRENGLLPVSLKFPDGAKNIMTQQNALSFM